MRILLDQAVHDHRNQGNNVLLDTALKRFKAFWPDAEFGIISHAPHLCRYYFPNAIPVSPETLLPLAGSADIPHKLLPLFAWRLLFEIRDFHMVQVLLKIFLTSRKKDDRWSVKDEVPENLNGAGGKYPGMTNYDFYVLTGGGYMCDSDKRFMLKVFDRLEKAVELGIPAVMVSQGVGPLGDSDLIKRGREVLPKIDYIMIREERATLPILDMLNVPRAKVVMTGDDAIEPAYLAHSEIMGNGIGLSLRIAQYTNVNAGNIASLKPLILQKAKQYNAELVAVPIDINDSDKSYVEEIISDYGKSYSPWGKFDNHAELIHRTSRCRVMVSGTFHAAVFAVSQGIPVIALANSTEYQIKATGLTAEFGEDGCRVINLSDPKFVERFFEAFDLAWSSAENLRPRLLQEAKRQINMGYHAYQKIFLRIGS